MVNRLFFISTFEQIFNMAFELIDWIIIGLFLGISLFISLRYQGEASKSLSDFFWEEEISLGMLRVYRW